MTAGWRAPWGETTRTSAIWSGKARTRETPSNFVNISEWHQSMRKAIEAKGPSCYKERGVAMNFWSAEIRRRFLLSQWQVSGIATQSKCLGQRNKIVEEGSFLDLWRKCFEVGLSEEGCPPSKESLFQIYVLYSHDSFWLKIWHVQGMYKAILLIFSQGNLNVNSDSSLRESSYISTTALLLLAFSLFCSTVAHHLQEWYCSLQITDWLAVWRHSHNYSLLWVIIVFEMVS